MYNRETVMQFLTQEYQADVNIRDYSGKRPHQYLADTEQTYLQRVLPNIKIGHLEKLEAQEKRSSKFGSLRASFRALRTWGSTESIPKKRTISTGSILHTSPKMRPKSLHVEHHRTFTPESSPKTKHRPLSTIETDRQLMPPPAVPSTIKMAKNSFAGNQPGDFHKSGSDSNIRASSTSTYI
ncbi:uncharacterized protein [Antedon mediterranea]|uniref:uncharacterized protein isoform X2 n=1 Tax=Antedon mediterranea TaxID=105859 RepID=UPI003AF57F61